MLTIFFATFLGGEGEIGLGTNLETIDDANSYPMELENAMQEVPNDFAGFFYLVFNILS